MINARLHLGNIKPKPNKTTTTKLAMLGAWQGPEFKP
jgi:hypothetical protein